MQQILFFLKKCAKAGALNSQKNLRKRLPEIFNIPHPGYQGLGGWA